jgi:hypothetical protein
MSTFWCRFLSDRGIFVTVACVAVILATPQGAFARGREGHQIIVIVAEHYMRPATAARMRQLLAPETSEEASGWAGEYRHDHRETGPWHYIDNDPMQDFWCSGALLFKEAAGGKSATTGDLAVTAGGLNPALPALTEHHFQIIGVYNHMIDERPRLFFVHFWKVGAPADLASGLKAALAVVNTR